MSSPLRREEMDAAATLAGIHSTGPAAMEGDVAPSQETPLPENGQATAEAGPVARHAEQHSGKATEHSSWFAGQAQLAKVRSAALDGVSLGPVRGTMPRYSESTGRIGVVGIGRPLFTADRRKLGQYIQQMPSTSPERFTGPSRAAEQTADDGEGVQMAGEQEPQGTGGSDEECNDNEAGDESDGESEDAGQVAGAFVQTPPWVVGDSAPQPLQFNVPTATGYEVKQLKTRININDAAAVQKANRARNQKVRRAKNKLGMPVLRHSTSGREFTAQHEDWLASEMIRYGAMHNGERISWRDLTANFNAAFLGQNRSPGSISAHFTRTPALSRLRATFRAVKGSDDE